MIDRCDILEYAEKNFREDILDVTDLDLSWTWPCAFCGETQGSEDREEEELYLVTQGHEKLVVCGACIDQTDVFIAAAEALDRERERSAAAYEAEVEGIKAEMKER